MRDVRAKLAKGEELDEDDIKYARERGIELPNDAGVGEDRVRSDSPTSPGESVPFDEMTKADLMSLAEQRGIEMHRSWTKDEMIATLEEGL